MTLAPDNSNYLYGAGRAYFKDDDDSGYIHLGNMTTLEIVMEAEEKIEHWESQTSDKVKDVDDVLKWSVMSNLVLEEYTAENLNIAFRGDGVQSLGDQSASYIDDDFTTTVSNQYMDLDYTDLFYTKVTHGTVSGGPFEDGETITGGSSSATAKVAWPATGHLELVNLSGTFTIGETITGGTSSATATTTAVDTIEDDIIVCDAATAVTRFTKGTDYDVDNIGGLLREISTGSIASNTAYVSADYSARTNTSVRAIAGSQATGELLFIGDPRRGPRYRVQCWNCNLNVSGGLAFISEDPAEIPIEVVILADVSSHPSEPFFRATRSVAA